MKTKAKEFVALTLLVLFSFVFWLTLSVLLPKLSWNETALIASAAVAAVLIFVVWGLVAVSVTDGFWVVFTWAFAAYSGLWIFWGLPFLAASTFIFVAGTIGYLRARGQIQKTLEGGIVRPLRFVLPLSATALAVAVAAALFQVSPHQNPDIKTIVPENLFARAVSSFEPTIKSIAPELEIVPETSHTLYITGVDFLEKQADVYKNIFPVAYAVGLFASLRFFGFLLYWFAILLVKILLHVLLKFDIISVKSIPRNIMIYSLS